MTGYIEEFKAKHFESDIDGNLSPVNLLKYLGEMAIDHSNSVDIDIDDLSENSKAWMIYKWRVKMDRYPKSKEIFKIKTWSSRLYKFYANREFIIYGEDGKEIGKASSLWLYIDMERKRPIRIPKDYADRYGCIPEQNFKEFIELKEDIKSDNILSFDIRKSDIDINRHVNNAIYLEWMLENIDMDIEKNYILEEFSILYKNEVFYGEKINSILEKEIKEEDKIIYNHKIYDDDQDKTYAKSIWKKR